jgi:hypothetical protein
MSNIYDAMLTDKNYYRLGLIKVFVENGQKPLCVTGKYKHREDLEWATFTSIRLFSLGEKNRTICDHVNINRESLSKYATLTSIQHNRKFYICGTVYTYKHYGAVRASISILEEDQVMPFWLTSQLPNVNIKRVETALIRYGGVCSG